MSGHAGIARHVSRLGGDLSVADVFRRIDGGFAVDAIFVASARFGSVEAGLEYIRLCICKRRRRCDVLGLGSCLRLSLLVVGAWVL